MTNQMQQFLAVTKALADPARLRIILALRDRELCVCQLTELLGLAFSTVSKHLSILQHAGLITARKDQRWVWYRLEKDSFSKVVSEAIDWVCKSLVGSAEAKADRERLGKILRTELVELRKGQRRRKACCKTE